MLTDYQQKTILRIRQLGPQYDDLTDEQLCELYSYWSDVHYSASWLDASIKQLIIFNKWATTTPIERVRNA